jgi:hypothetical protein
LGAPQSVTQINPAATSYQTADIVFGIGERIKSMAQSVVGQFSIPQGNMSEKQIQGSESEQQSLHHNFLYSIETLFEQTYQGILNLRGIYANNPRKLSIIIGDKGAQQIMITKDMLLEDFRIFVERVDDEKTSKASADATLFQLLQAKILDPTTYEQWVGRATMDKVGNIVRESGIRQRMAAKGADKKNQEMSQIQNLNTQHEKERQEQREDKLLAHSDIEADKNRTNKLESIDRRGQWKTMSDEKKAQYAERLANMQKQMEGKEK